MSFIIIKLQVVRVALEALLDQPVLASPPGEELLAFKESCSQSPEWLRWGKIQGGHPGRTRPGSGNKIFCISPLLQI